MDISDLVRSFPLDGSQSVCNPFPDPGLFLVRTPRALRRQPALIKASAITAGLPWTHSTILRAGKYDADQHRPLRAPLRLRGLFLISISPIWCPLHENKGGLPTSSVKGLNYEVLDGDSGPLNARREDEGCALNSLMSPMLTTGTRKISFNPTPPVISRQRLPVRRSTNRLPSARKLVRERNHPGLPSVPEIQIRKPTESPSLQSMTVGTLSAPREECAFNSLMPLGSATGRSGPTVLDTDDEKLTGHRMPSVGKGYSVRRRINTEPFDNLETHGPKSSLSPPAILDHAPSPPRLLVAPISHARRRFAAPSKEMLPLLVETELALSIPMEHPRTHHNDKPITPLADSSKSHTNDGKPESTQTILKHINTSNPIVAETSPPLITPAEARVACARVPSSRFVHDYRLEYTHLPTILQTTIRIP